MEGGREEEGIDDGDLGRKIMLLAGVPELSKIYPEDLRDWFVDSVGVELVVSLKWENCINALRGMAKGAAGDRVWQNRICDCESPVSPSLFSAKCFAVAQSCYRFLEEACVEDSHLSATLCELFDREPLIFSPKEQAVETPSGFFRSADVCWDADVGASALCQVAVIGECYPRLRDFFLKRVSVPLTLALSRCKRAVSATPLSTSTDIGPIYDQIERMLWTGDCTAADLGWLPVKTQDGEFHPASRVLMQVPTELQTDTEMLQRFLPGPGQKCESGKHALIASREALSLRCRSSIF